MPKLNPLRGTGEDHVMLADYRAAAQCRETDVAGLSGAGMAVARPHRALAEIDRATHVADYRGKIHAYGSRGEVEAFAEGLSGVKVRPITASERKELALRKRQAYRNP